MFEQKNYFSRLVYQS